jgi:hypothetical protein
MPYARAIDDTDILHYAPIKHEIFPGERTIVNTTKRGHPLYSGNVHRTVVQEGDDLYVVTHGYGTGRKLPDAFSRWLWQKVDEKIRDEFKPPSTFDAFTPPHLLPGPDPSGNIWPLLGPSPDWPTTRGQMHRSGALGGSGDRKLS